MRSMTAGAVAGGAVQTRKTASIFFQGGVERFGGGEVATEFFDGGREIGGIGIAEEGADLDVGVEKFGEDVEADGAGGADD
jgi:hypothetical protein